MHYVHIIYMKNIMIILFSSETYVAITKINKHIKHQMYLECLRLDKILEYTVY